MPKKSFMRAIRSRRRNRRGQLGVLTGITTGVLTLMTLFLGFNVVLIASLNAQVIRNLPDVGIIENQFGLRGIESFRPMVVLDRTGNHVLFEARQQSTKKAEWVRVFEDGSSTLPKTFMDAIIFRIDDSFWSNPGYDVSQVISRLLVELGVREVEDERVYTITERLVMTALIPPTDKALSGAVRELRIAYVASELTQRYSKAQILAWYLNSVNFGFGVYGIDAASLHFFQSHAEELALAEGALLVALMDDRSLEPGTNPEPAIQARNEVLELLYEEGALPKRQTQRLQAQDLDGEFERIGEAVEDEAKQIIWDELVNVLGEDVLHRSGLTVRTTIDHDMQLQVECTSMTQQMRLNGLASDSSAPAADGSTCVAAGFLPPLRPRDIGVDHNVEDWGVVVLDPVNGEILAISGSVQASRSLDSAFYPFVYLTAFSQGHSPGSMVIDTQRSLANSTTVVQLSEAHFVGHGPVRIRTALANGYIGAAAFTFELVSESEVSRIAEQIGLRSFMEVGATSNLSTGETATNLLGVTTGYGVFANGGLLIGSERGNNGDDNGSTSLIPSVLLEIKDVQGVTLYKWEPMTRSVLSSQLAFLLTDVLSDDEARWPSMGHPNPLEIGRPAGAVAALDPEEYNNWAIGFTPQLAVGVWIGNADSPLQAITRSNGATSIWHAVIRYASRTLPPENWEMPAGISIVEVCDPSGLLPTRHCPKTVTELFLAGTEPTSYDNLYQGVLINRETGKLATLFTPLDLVEERTYFVPPPQAIEWAEVAGLDLPPQEYDTLSDESEGIETVGLLSPEPFEVVSGQIYIRGDANPDEFAYYRLQFGEGLYPTQWTQLGEDRLQEVRSGRLGVWDTGALSGLFTLQLLVVLGDGQVYTSAVPLRVDNQPPTVQMTSPFDGQSYQIDVDPWITFQVSVEDEFDVDKVEYFLDERLIGSTTSYPHAFQWAVGNRPMSIKAYVRVIDVAGNVTVTEPVIISIER